MRECLESVLAQSFSPIEVIVVDDGSTDSTAEIASSFPQVKLIRQENRGLSEARNAGIRAAKGEMITFVDSDDKLLPGALTLLASLADGADMACGGFVRQPNASRPTAPAQARTVSGKDALQEALYQRGVNSSACGKLFRTEMVRRVMFTPGLSFEDIEFFARIALITKSVAIVDTPVYFYRNNPSSFINNFSRRHLHALTVTEKVAEMVSSECPELLPAAHDRQLSANFYVVRHLGRTDWPDRNAIRRQCLEKIRQLRGESLRNPRVRIKNRLASLLSYLLPL